MAESIARQRPLALPYERVLAAGVIVILTAAGGQVQIPHTPVPFTLQTLFVLLAGALLGPAAGAGAMCVYLAAGLSGLPVFSAWGSGLARILGPTGGYLLAFPVAAYLVGTLARRRTSFAAYLLSMFAGLLVIFSLGTLQLNLVWFNNWSEAFANGFLIFSFWDLVKLVAAASIARAIGKRFTGTQPG